MTITATACRVVFKITIFWEVFSLPRMEIFLDALLSVSWNFRLNALTVMLLVSFNVSWRHTARGLCLTIKSQFIKD